MAEQSQKKVLLAEDNLVNQKLATMLLQQLGLTVRVAENGIEAVKAAEQEDFTVILMDCQMPDMDGFEATRRIRKMESTRGTYTPIIAVTALAMVGDRERCISVGMDDYISKPIDRQVLKIKLNHWTQREFVLRNQELARKYSHPSPIIGAVEDPINLRELEDFYQNDLDDVLSTFMESAEKMLQQIRLSIEARKEEDLAHLAHEIKGASASVGAKGMAKLGMYLERAAGLRDWKEASDTYAALVGTFAGVRRFLMETRTRLPSEEVYLPTRE